jgi:hypothetical protein
LDVISFFSGLETLKARLKKRDERTIHVRLRKDYTNEYNTVKGEFGKNQGATIEISGETYVVFELVCGTWRAK